MIDGEAAWRERLARELAREGDVRLAVLFGSRARGRARPGSDLDLAVRAPGADLLGIAGRLSAALGIDVDVVSLDHADIPLLAEIVEHGVVVHEAAPGEQARWRSAAIAALETDLPWYARMRDAWLRRVARDGVGSW